MLEISQPKSENFMDVGLLSRDIDRIKITFFLDIQLTAAPILLASN